MGAWRSHVDKGDRLGVHWRLCSCEGRRVEAIRKACEACSNEEQSEVVWMKRKSSSVSKSSDDRDNGVLYLVDAKC